MGLILLVYTLEVVFSKCGQHCNFKIMKGSEEVLDARSQKADLGYCLAVLDAVAVLRRMPADEHGGLRIQLESAFRQHEEEMSRRPVAATRAQALTLEALDPVVQVLVDARTAAIRRK